VSDTDFFCPTEDNKKDIIDPDFYVPTAFERFWAQFDEDHLSVDLTEVQRAAWIDAVSEVNMFSDMTPEEITA